MGRLRFSLLTALILTLLLVFPQYRSRPTQASSSSRDLVVKLALGFNIDFLIQQLGLAKNGEIKSENRIRINVPTNIDINKVVDLLKLFSDVLVIESDTDITVPVPDPREPINFTGGTAQILGSDPSSFDNQALVAFLQLESARAYSRGGGVKVAVIDTGIDLLHPRFAGRIASGGLDLVDFDSIPQDEAGGVGSGHGTFVAGLVLLVAPDAQILPIRVMSPSGVGRAFAVALAIRHAVDQGAKVINLSMGTYQRTDVVSAAIKYAMNNNCLVLAAAGNNNLEINTIYPAADINVLSIAATNLSDQKATFSNYSGKVALSAPGVDLVSTFPGGLYARWSGTSFATPLVAAESAMLLAALPADKRDDSDVKSILFKPESLVSINVFNPPEYQGKLGKGRIAPLLALQQALQY